MFTQVDVIKGFYNDSGWEERLIGKTAQLNLDSASQWARKLLEANFTKQASLLIEQLINSGHRWSRVKHGIFGQLVQEVDIRCFDRYLSFQWNNLTSDLLNKAFELDKKLNTRESQSFLKKLKLKLDAENYLKRDAKSISKILSFSLIFFASLNKAYEPICMQMQSSLTGLSTFYTKISQEDASVLKHSKFNEQKKREENDKIIYRQQEFLRSAINYEIRSVSEQSIVDIFGREEAPQQIKKLLTLGVVVFDINDIKARNQAAEEYAAEQMKKMFYESS